jgi:hypothetical protein
VTEETPIDSAALLAEHADRQVRGAKDYLDQQSKARETAMEYYSGEMKDLPVAVGRSSVVSMDVRAIIKKVMPSVMRTILGGGSVVKYIPVGPGDEDGAQQATDYVNLVVMEEAGAKKAIHDAIHDALLLKTGIMKWCAYKHRKATIQHYTGQPDEAVVGLFDDPDVEILNYSTSEETDADVLALNPEARRHSFKLRRIVERTTPKLEAVPRGSFLITPGADSIEDAELVGEELFLTRSDLVSMGYDKDLVWSIPAYDDHADDDESRMGEDFTESWKESRKAMQVVRIYEVYPKVDMDNDGVAEIYRLVYGAGTAAEKGGSFVVLGLEAVDEAPYSDVVMERDPHQFEGHSIYEDMRDIQRVKTALLRATMDNLYAQNNQRPAVQTSAVEDPGQLVSGESGPIWLKPGYSAKDAIQWEQVPFVAAQSFEMLGYMDEVAKDRTGITDASGGLDPENLQNTSATAAVMMSESGVAQADSIVRSLAHGGLRKAFKGLLRLVIAHADGPRTVQIRGEWAQYDPKVWNADMDCTVNVGLGGGTKERDMAVLQIVYGLQKELLMTIGADNPYVKPKQLYNTLEKLTETAGFPSAEPFFSEPDEAEVQAKLQEAKNAPDPEMQKVQAQIQGQMQLEQMKSQASMQMEQGKLQLQAQAEKMKAEVARDKEMAQMQADMQVKMQDARTQAMLEEQKMNFEREKFMADLSLREREMTQAREIKLMELQAQVGMAEHSASAKSAEDGDRKAGEGKSLDALKSALDAMNKPRRVIRDDNGEIVGVEPLN